MRRLFGLLRSILPALWLGLGAFGLAGPACAHTLSETHSQWIINGSRVEVTVAIPIIEVKRLGPPNTDISDAQISRYMTPLVGVTADGKACADPAGAKPLASTAQFRQVQFEFQCPSPDKMKLTFSAFYALVPSHTDFAQIQTSKGDFIEQLFTKDAQTLDLSGGTANALRSAGFLKYVQMGIMHIFTGVDHMSFLVGLVLLSRRLRDLLFVVTGFTIGHSATLALAVTGILRPHAEYIDALVALTIALVGAENIAVASGKPGTVALCVGGFLFAMALGRVLGFGGLPSLLTLGAGLFSANYLMVSGHIRDAARIRLVVTLVFGLIHGFGFAAGLLEMQLPTDKLAELLVGFNIGVECGQVTVVLTVIGLAALLVKMKMGMPRPIVVDVASSALVAIGLYWFVSRSYA